MLSIKVGLLPTLKKLVPPPVLAVPLADVKAHLRLDQLNTDEDALIENLIKAATEWVENYCRISLIKTRWRMALDVFPTSGEPIELPIRPLMISEGSPPEGSVPLLVSSRGNIPDTFLRVGVRVDAGHEISPAINYHPANGGDVQTIGPDSGAVICHDGNPPTVSLYDLGFFWPMTELWRPYAVSVEWNAGFGITTESVPAPIKAAIKLLVAHFFLNREAVSPSSGMPIPFGVAALLGQYESGELV